MESLTPAPAQTGERPAFFEENNAFVTTPVYDGAKLLVGNVIVGPAIIEEITTSIVVFPGWQVRLDNPGGVCDDAGGVRFALSMCRICEA